MIKVIKNNYLMLRNIYKYCPSYIFVSILDSIGLLTNTKENILSSLIHMFCNRYNGNNVWENEMRALTRHYLYEKIQKQKHYPNP